MEDKQQTKRKPKVDIEKAWKDSQYHDSLDSEQQAEVPANPTTLQELEDDDLEDISGGTYTVACYSV